VTRQETTFTRTINRNRRLQTKHRKTNMFNVNTASQSECERQCCYSGFNFSHYDLPFPTRYCIPFVRSGLYQLVIRVKEFRVSAHDLDSHCIIRFCPRRGHHAFSESSCVSLPHRPRWLFLLLRHRKAFLLLLIRSLL